MQIHSDVSMALYSCVTILINFIIKQKKLDGMTVGMKKIWIEFMRSFGMILWDMKDRSSK